MLPEYNPAIPTTDLFLFDSYADKVAKYGEPPAGYRWLKVGEKTCPLGTICAMAEENRWFELGREIVVDDDQFPLASPLVV